MQHVVGSTLGINESDKLTGENHTGHPVDATIVNIFLLIVVKHRSL